MDQRYENVDKNIEKIERFKNTKPKFKGSREKLTLAMLSDQALHQEPIHKACTWGLASNMRNE